MAAQTISTATSSEPGLPAPMTREFDRSLSRFLNALEETPGNHRQKSISCDRAPSADERSAIKRRHDQIAAVMVPASKDQAGRWISALRAPFPTQAGTDVQTVVSIYLSVLAPHPEWAICEACRRYLGGTYGSIAFAPSPPELANRCADLTLPWRLELSHLRAVLEAQVYSVNEPLKVATDRKVMDVMEYWEKVVRPEIMAQGQPTPTRPQETPEEALQRLHAAKDTPIAISEGLAALLDRQAKERAA